MPVKTLYVCYFGLLEPLVQTQVLPYLREIRKDAIEVTLLTFEPEFHKSWSAAEIEAAREELAAEGITWHALGYHKRPSVPATAFDILNGARIIRQLISNGNFDVIHGRTLIAVIMAAFARKLSRRKPRIIYDMRGFFAEEYTDAGIWPENGFIYRTAKRFDKWGMNQSDGFVVLTEKAREILFPESVQTGRDNRGRPVEVIPCCIDPSRFEMANDANRIAIRERLGADDRTVVAYVGSFGGWYLTDEMFEFFNAARDVYRNPFIMVLTQRGTSEVEERLLSRGFGQEDVFVASVPPTDVPEYLSAADVAISFIKSCYSKQASSPTKIAEYLACGLPIISNSGIGDLDQQIVENGVGVLIHNFDPEAYAVACRHINELGDVQNRCRAAANHLFDLVTVGGRRYRRLYKNVLQS
jgi:glycosyltransferase involved in cell wall biosynthesis